MFLHVWSVHDVYKKIIFVCVCINTVYGTTPGEGLHVLNGMNEIIYSFGDAVASAAEEGYIYTELTEKKCAPILYYNSHTY